MQTAQVHFEPGEAILVPVRVRREATAKSWGRLLIEANWSQIALDYEDGAVIGGYLNGVIVRASFEGVGKWHVRLDNGLAGGTTDLPGDMIVSALAPMKAAA